MAIKIKKISYDISANGCHICTSHGCDKYGNPIKYSNLHKNRKLIYYIYITTYGQILENTRLGLKCGNKKCINPEHISILEGKKSNSIKKALAWEITKKGCWECTSHKPDKNRYRSISVDGKKIKLHRYMYEKYKGPIPDGFLIRHICDNPPCINPDHLLIGTPKDNTQDMCKRERTCSKLNKEQVLEIRASKDTHKQLAIKYGVDRTTISLLKRFVTWSHLPL